MLFVAGIILIGVEIFVIPGFGVAGISGIALCAMSLLAMMIPNAPLEIPWPRTDLMWGYFRRGGVALTIGFLGSVALMVVLSRILPKSSLSNKLFLAPAAEYHEPPTTEQHPIHSIKAGDEGVAATTCRPSGQVRIGEHLLDAVADGTMIASGTKVRVLRNDGNRLVIEPTET
jgi:membrane-bound serine protease (ClpP class)